MELTKMYPASVNSKSTNIVGAIDETDTTIEVEDASILPEAPNLLVLGTDENAETVLMTAKNGNILTVERAVQGTAINWPAGTNIARNFTAKDWNDIKENVEGLHTGVKELKESLASSIESANTAAERANTEAANANSYAKAANDAADDASNAAYLARSGANMANSAADAANAAAENTNVAISSVHALETDIAAEKAEMQTLRQELSGDMDDMKAEFQLMKASLSQMDALFAQTLDDCTDTEKVYVLGNGNLAAYMYQEIEILPYKNLAEPLPDNTTDTTKWVNGYRLSSTGVSAQSGTSLCNTIDVKNGDVIRISGVTLRENVDRTLIEIVRADTGETVEDYQYFQNDHLSGNKVSLSYDGLENGVYKFSIPADYSNTVKSFRFAMPTPEDASKVIITVNEEIDGEMQVIKEYRWTDTGLPFTKHDYQEEILALEQADNEKQAALAEVEEDIANIVKRVDAVENSTAVGLPDYWQEYLAEKIETIKTLQKAGGKDCFSFISICDIHRPSNLGKRSPLIAKHIADACAIKHICVPGDTQTRGCWADKEKFIAEEEAFQQMITPIIEKLLRMEGNHDRSYKMLDRDGDGTLSNSTSDGTIKAPEDRETYVNSITPEEFYDYCYRKVGMIPNVHFDETGTAYYVDDTANKARYICLNSHCVPYEENADGTAKYSPMWVYRFTQSQFDFLTNEALVGLTDKWSVMAFAHVPLTQEIGDRYIMADLLKAYKNKTAYSGSYAGEYDFDAVTVNADFSDAKGSFVGYFHGHTHIDSLHTSFGINVIGTRCDGLEENTPELRAERVTGTVTEQSFDVFTVNARTRTIHVTKIGAGSDRTITY